jgi:hypothetical protein
MLFNIVSIMGCDMMAIWRNSLVGYMRAEVALTTCSFGFGDVEPPALADR